MWKNRCIMIVRSHTNCEYQLYPQVLTVTHSYSQLLTVIFTHSYTHSKKLQLYCGKEQEIYYN